MQTWVLIMMMTVHAGESMVAVPGYTSKASCELAADAYYVNSGRTLRRKVFCIPGPVILLKETQ